MEYETNEEITESEWNDIESDMRNEIITACENSGLDEESIVEMLNNARLQFKHEYDGNFGHGAFRQATLEDLKGVADVVRRIVSELPSDLIEEDVFDGSVETEDIVEIQEVQAANNVAKFSKSSGVVTVANSMLHHDFKSLELDELVIQFESIGNQAQLLQGQILLEARTRFASDKEFGQWVESTSTLCASTTHQHRNRLINLAKFFTETRPMNSIAVTVAYEIAAPKNSAIAEKLYESAVSKKLSVEEIKNLAIELKSKKGISMPEVKGTQKTLSENETKLIDFLMTMNLPKNEALKLLQNCCKHFK